MWCRCWGFVRFVRSNVPLLFQSTYTTASRWKPTSFHTTDPTWRTTTLTCGRELCDCYPQHPHSLSLSTIMGLTTSKQELNPLNHPAIWISEPTFFSDFQTTQFPTDPVPIKDVALWEEFSKKMNILVKRLNQYLAWMYVMYLVVLVVCLLIGIGGRILWVQIVTFPVIFFNMAGHYLIVQRNQRVDKAIDILIQEYEIQFLPHNIQLQYVTKWTQFCKPRHQRAMRVLLLGPVPNQDVIIENLPPSQGATELLPGEGEI